MLGNGVEMGFILCRILGPLVLDSAPNHFVLGAQLTPVEKRLVCIPVIGAASGQQCDSDIIFHLSIDHFLAY